MMSIATYYIVVTPKINKELTSLPTNGYLFVADLKSFPSKRDCEKMNADDFKQLLDVVLSLKLNGTQSVAFYCEKMVTPDGFVDGVKDDLVEFLKNANRHGVSIGIVISGDHLKLAEFLNTIKKLPFMSYYHYIENKDTADMQAIQDFGKSINDELNYIVERTNNLIFNTDDFSVINPINPLFGEINGVVMPVESLKGELKYQYPESIQLIFMPSD